MRTAGIVIEALEMEFVVLEPYTEYFASQQVPKDYVIIM